MTVIYLDEKYLLEELDAACDRDFPSGDFRKLLTKASTAPCLQNLTDEQMLYLHGYMSASYNLGIEGCY